MAESDFNFDRWEPAITTDIARMMLRHELSDNPDKLYLIRSQADEWAIRVARRIM